MIKDAGKSVRKLAREWCAIAYERELNAELAKLHDAFRSWEGKAISPFELTDIIHRFHQDEARQLYIKYEMGGNSSPDWLLPAAIRDGILSREELPAGLLNEINFA